MGVCLALLDLTVVVKQTCLKYELIGRGNDLRWRVGRIASCCIFYSSFHLVDYDLNGLVVVIWDTEVCLVFMEFGMRNIRVRRVKMVKDVPRQHSAVFNIATPKGADKQSVNSREELLAKGFVLMVVLVEEYESGGVGIPEGRDLRCGGSNGNIWCCTRI